jgi:penicillin-binding protein 2
MFAIIFFRLWFLQVLSSHQYTLAATQNQIRSIDIPAPRGEITDRFGRVLVRSELGFDVEIEPPALPTPVGLNVNMLGVPHDDAVIYHQLARVLGRSSRPARCRVDNPKHPTQFEWVELQPIACVVAQQLQQVPYDPVVVAKNVQPIVQEYLSERQNQFPGVAVKQVYQRIYPYGELAAQVLGTVGPITPETIGTDPSKPVTRKEVDRSRFKGLPLSAQVGQLGLEYEYDRDLRGTDGSQNVQVNALGQFEGYLPPTPPTPGDTLRTTLDAKLQAVGEQALAASIATNPSAVGGAFVAINPQNGEVYAMGSNPTYAPSLFTSPLSTAEYTAHFGPGSNDPMLNRATQAPGQTGSTFKMITATAALESGVWSPGRLFTDGGQYCFAGSTLCLHNSGHVANGTLNIVQAIQVSDDVFFYNLGALLNADPTKHPNGGALQEWARKYGIGRKSGIDLPGELSGTLPSPRQTADLYYHQEVPCENATGLYRGHPKHPASLGGCGIANNPYWTIGDNVNTAVGQGDDQVTPLQLAVAYSALANGGRVVRPHIGLEVENSTGAVVQKLPAPTRRNIHLSPVDRQVIMEGLRAAASQPGGTSYDVMGNFPEQVYGKTGTAQYVGQQDYAWYACFVPRSATTRPIAVVVTVEQGGFGDVAAAPVAREILSQWFFGKSGGYHAGVSTTL